MTISRPQAGEYADFQEGYISIVPGDDAFESLSAQASATIDVLRSLPAERETFRYAPGKWSVRETVGHMIDTERVFAYRALRFSRNDQTPLPGFEQDHFIEGGRYDHIQLANLLEEFETVRRSTVFLFRNMNQEMLHRKGTASGREMSVRAIAWAIAGHELYHMKLFRENVLSR
jgi:uncharacterized damage-inducible protein DinB